MATKNTHIFTDAEAASLAADSVQDDFLESKYGSMIFVSCEDGKTLMVNETEDSFVIQEYIEE